MRETKFKMKKQAAAVVVVFKMKHFYAPLLSYLHIWAPKEQLLPYSSTNLWWWWEENEKRSQDFSNQEPTPLSQI